MIGGLSPDKRFCDALARMINERPEKVTCRRSEK